MFPDDPEQDSGMKVNTGFRDEAEQFQVDPGKVFGFAGVISAGS